MLRDDELIAETLRLQQRYAEEVVEGFNLCPWARSARERGAVERVVLLQRDDEEAPALEAIRALEERPEVEVALLLFPSLLVDPPAFDAFTQRLRAADERRHGGRPVFAAASFHPDYPLDLRSAAAAVPFFRRTPDPTIQLIRLSLVEQMRGPNHGKFLFDFSPEGWSQLLERQRRGSTTERITQENYDRLISDSPERIAAVLDDIRADRERVHARLREQ